MPPFRVRVSQMERPEITQMGTSEYKTLGSAPGRARMMPVTEETNTRSITIRLSFSCSARCFGKRVLIRRSHFFLIYLFTHPFQKLGGAEEIKILGQLPQALGKFCQGGILCLKL